MVVRYKLTALTPDALPRLYLQVEKVEVLESLAERWDEPIFEAGLYDIVFHDGRIFAVQVPKRE